MNESVSDSNRICLAVVGHDPEGRWSDHLESANSLLTSLYPNRLISLTEKTHYTTIDTAIALGWEVDVEALPMGSARFAVMRRGLETTNGYINLWDGDRLLHAAKRAPQELDDIVQKIPQYDCFIAGATRLAIATHQPSMTCWEEVKSWVLGHYLGIQGDIATRGCFGFSREFARFLVQHEWSAGDDTDALFAILPLVFKSLIVHGQSATGRETVGYAEYDVATSYEDCEFDGLSPQASAAAKNTHQDFMRRGISVLQQIMLAQSIGQKYNLGFPPKGEMMIDVLRGLVKQHGE